MRKLFTIICKITVFFIGWAVLAGIIEIPSEDPAIWRFWAEMIPCAVMVLFTLVFLRIERGKICIPVRENMARGAACGCFTGLVWIGIATAVPVVLEQLTLSGVERVPRLWLWMASAFINVVMQELLVRGYIYQLLKKEYNLPAAVIVTTALFTFMHGGAFEAGLLPVIHVVTMCLFASALYEAEGMILAPIMAHAVWNIVGALVLGGVSLAEDYPHMFTMTASGNALLSGGAYRIEGSIVVTVLNLVLMLVFYGRYRQGRRR